MPYIHLLPTAFRRSCYSKQADNCTAQQPEGGLLCTKHVRTSSRTISRDMREKSAASYDEP